MDNFRLPAEWEQQSVVWLAWPGADHFWADNRQRIKNRFAALIGLISSETPVKLVCKKEFQAEAEKHIFDGCALLNNIEYFNFDTNDVWFRDFGPMFTLNDKRELQLIDFQFNAWGGKYPFDLDNLIPEKISTQLSYQCIKSSSILEGGAIDVNGNGVLMTTEDVILNKNRNPEVSKEQYESIFADLLGITQTIWLKKGIANDDTDGHVDNLARFVNEYTVLLASCDSKNENYNNLKENKKILEQTLIQGQHIKVIDLPLPDPVVHNGEILPSSYLNFMISNNLILVPTYDQPENDKHALKTLQFCFPEHKVRAFDCRDFLQEGGAIHCLTMNQFC